MFDLIRNAPSSILMWFVVFATVVLVFFAIVAVGLKMARRGAEVPGRTGGIPGKITGAKVTAKQVATSDHLLDKEPYLAVHIEFEEDGRLIRVTDPPRYNGEFDTKVRDKFLDRRLLSRPVNGVMPLKIEGEAEKDRAEISIANGGLYEFSLDEPIPITVFRTEKGSYWQVA